MPHDTVTLWDGRVIELTPEYLAKLEARGWLPKGQDNWMQDEDDAATATDDERARLEEEIEEEIKETEGAIIEGQEEVDSTEMIARNLRTAVARKIVHLHNLKARLAALPGERD